MAGGLVGWVELRSFLALWRWLWALEEKCAQVKPWSLQMRLGWTAGSLTGWLPGLLAGLIAGGQHINIFFCALRAKYLVDMLFICS